VSGSPEIRAAVTRVTAALGLDASVVDGLADARTAWSEPAVVLVGADALEPASSPQPSWRLPRRNGVAVVTVTTPEPTDLRRALEIGAIRVLTLPGDDRELVTLVADVLDGGRPPAKVLAVVGGRGGAGATTLAVALAVTAAREGHDVVLVDADPVGGGVDLALGAEQRPGVRWPDLAGTTGRIHTAALADSLPRAHGVRVLSWDRGPHVDVDGQAAGAVIGAAMRACDLVVVDVSRHLAGAVTGAALAHAHTSVLVVPAALRAVAAAGRVAARICASGPTPGIVVRRPSRARLPARTVAELLGLPVVGVLTDDDRVERALEVGEPPGLAGRGSLSRVASTLLTAEGLGRGT